MRRLKLAGLLLVAAIVGAGVLHLTLRSRGQGAGLAHLETVTVRPAPIAATVLSMGEVDSSHKTLIECELEALSFRNAGYSIESSGSSMIIELVDEGTVVYQGQVLCRLDASEYEEMVRQQRIELEEDRAQAQSARLELERLEVSLVEYRDGIMNQLKEQHQGEIAMARADVERQKERLAWSKQMSDLGYLPLSRLSTENQTLLQTELTLKQRTLSFKNLIDYTAPKQMLTIMSAIDGARAQLSYEEDRVENDEENLDRYMKQIERCTIRAPHDGFLIYAQDDDDDEPIELGVRVRESQDLFYLPDLSQMEVKAKLHETVVTRVKPGMPARVRIEAFAGRELPGEVTFVAPLPASIQSRYANTEVRYYDALIRLDETLEGLMPGMTAESEILVGQNHAALALPPSAIMIDAERRETCYVVRGDQVERRLLETGLHEPQWIEVTGGLREGDRVVVNPEQLDASTVAITVADTSTALQ